MTLSPHSLLVDGCSVYLWNAFSLSVSSFCHAQHSSARHWPSTATVNDNGAAGKCSSPNIREETHRGIRLDWVSAFLRKKAYSQLFWVTKKLSVTPPHCISSAPWWRPLLTGLVAIFHPKKPYQHMPKKMVRIFATIRRAFRNYTGASTWSKRVEDHVKSYRNFPAKVFSCTVELLIE